MIAPYHAQFSAIQNAERYSPFSSPTPQVNGTSDDRGGLQTVNGHGMVRSFPQMLHHSFVKRFSAELSKNHACCRFALMYSSSPHAIYFLWGSSPPHAQVRQTEATCPSFSYGRYTSLSFVRLIATALRMTRASKFDEWRVSHT